jgi:N-acetyl-anhydromuramyl-L-alanine amidase AmpD
VFRVLNSDSIHIWDSSQHFSEQAKWKISKGTTIKYTTPPPGTPSFAQAFKIVGANGEESSATYFLSRKILEENTAVLIRNIKKEVDTILTPSVCTPPNTSSQDQGQASPFTEDSNFNFTAAENYALTSKLNDPKKLEIVPREEWDANAPKKSLATLNNPTEIVIHHTVTERDASIKEIQSIHQNENNWDDIGYNYLIKWDEEKEQWRVYEGRVQSEAEINGCRMVAVGSHARGCNDSTIGIAIVGNYSPEGPYNPTGYDRSLPQNKKQLSRDAIDTLGTLIKKLQGNYPTIKDIKAHGSNTQEHWQHAHYGIDRVPHAAKDCPGEGVIHVAAAFRHRFYPDKGKKIR